MLQPRWPLRLEAAASQPEECDGSPPSVSESAFGLCHHERGAVRDGVILAIEDATAACRGRVWSCDAEQAVAAIEACEPAWIEGMPKPVTR
jgi:hypothetical protein